MNEELQNDLSRVANCLQNAETENAISILLSSLKRYPNSGAWKLQIENLIKIKDYISSIPAINRTLTHSLLEQTLMVCLERGLNGGLSVQELEQILISEPDNYILISPQEALEYKLGQLSLIAMRALHKNQHWQSALFFLNQLKKHNTPLNPEDYLIMAEIYRNNQQPNESVSCYKKALMQI